MSSIPRPTTCQLFTAQKAHTALDRLHNQRAQDHEGLRTEHCAHGHAALAPILSQMFNHAICHGFPPS